MDVNLKICVIYTNKEALIFNQLEEFFKTKEDAIQFAENMFNRLSKHDKKHVEIIVGTCNIDEDGDYAIDRYGEYDMDIYDIYWDSSKEVNK